MQPSSASNGAAHSERRKSDVAVYVDYENLYISLRSTVGSNPQFDVIMDKCREFGRVTIARAYCDWSEFARVVTSQMFSSGVEPIYVPTRKFYDAKTRSQATKNSVDIHIAIDIMKDVLSTKNIDIFVLVSGDRDFVPLMNQIRAAGKEVYAIGVAGCTSSELAVAVDEMFYYHQLLENEEELAAEQRDIYAKLVRAIEIARGRGYRTTLGVIKPIMREIVVGFDERKFRNAKGVPFQQFKQFCVEAERNGFIKVIDSGGAIDLALVSEDPAKLKRQAEEEREAARARAQAHGRRPASAALTSSEPASGETAEEEVAEGEAAPSSTGRRRGRRGGRRRRKGGVDGMRPEGLAAGDAEGDEAEDHAGHPSTDDDGRYPEGPSRGNGPDSLDGADDDERDDHEPLDDRGSRLERPPVASRDERPERAPAVRTERSDRVERSPAPPRAARPERDERPERAERVDTRSSASHSDDEDDDDMDDANVSTVDVKLPVQALDDLKAMLDTFGGRAPSQRRLIARLKKGATNGELNGSYKEGQFLLLVRKAMEDGHLEKISKGFYSGLKWAGEGEAATQV